MMRSRGRLSGQADAVGKYGIGFNRILLRRAFATGENGHLQLLDIENATRFPDESVGWRIEADVDVVMDAQIGSSDSPQPTTSTH